MQHFTTAPPSAAPGLDLFAAAWLERFTAHGGSVIVNPDGQASIFQLADHRDVPSYEPLPEEFTEEQRRSRDTIDRWMFLGRQRELEELLKLVPGGRDAVKAHARAFATHAYSDGTMAYT